MYVVSGTNDTLSHCRERTENYNHSQPSRWHLHHTVLLDGSERTELSSLDVNVEHVSDKDENMTLQRVIS